MSDAKPEPYRSRTVLVCTAAGCRSTYTYLGGTPRVMHNVADLERDRVLALQAAAEWGWTLDPATNDRSDRCPQHPHDEDDVDHGQGF